MGIYGTLLIIALVLAITVIYSYYRHRQRQGHQEEARRWVRYAFHSVYRGKEGHTALRLEIHNLHVTLHYADKKTLHLIVDAVEWHRMSHDNHALVPLVLRELSAHYNQKEKPKSFVVRTGNRESIVENGSL